MSSIKEGFFRPGKVSSQDKAFMTDQAAKQIITTEAAQRAHKTERLRQLREAKEAAVIALPSHQKKSVSGKNNSALAGDAAVKGNIS